MGTVGEGSAPGTTSEVGRIEIAVSYVEGGAATRLLGELPIGGVIDASGPYGRFCLQPADTHPRYLLLATGTGVTPYRAMLPQIRQLLAAGDREVVLLYGVRNEQELLYGEEFEAFVPRFQLQAAMPMGATRISAPLARLSRLGRPCPSIASSPIRVVLPMSKGFDWPHRT